MLTPYIGPPATIATLLFLLWLLCAVASLFEGQSEDPLRRDPLFWKIFFSLLLLAGWLDLGWLVGIRQLRLGEWLWGAFGLALFLALLSDALIWYWCGRSTTQNLSAALRRIAEERAEVRAAAAAAQQRRQQAFQRAVVFFQREITQRCSPEELNLLTQAQQLDLLSPQELKRARRRASMLVQRRVHPV